MNHSKQFGSSKLREKKEDVGHSKHNKSLI